MQYGVVRGSQVLRQWKQFLTFSRCLRIRFTKGLRSARPGIWTGLWTIVTSSFCLDVHLFKFVRRIAFFRGYETCCHLHAGKTERKIMSDIFFIKTPPPNTTGIFYCTFLQIRELPREFPEFLFIAVVFMKFYFFTGVAQMAARFRTFDDNQICCRVVVPIP